MVKYTDSILIYVRGLHRLRNRSIARLSFEQPSNPLAFPTLHHKERRGAERKSVQYRKVPQYHRAHQTASLSFSSSSSTQPSGDINSGQAATGREMKRRRQKKKELMTLVARKKTRTRMKRKHIPDCTRNKQPLIALEADRVPTAVSYPFQYRS